MLPSVAWTKYLKTLFYLHSDSLSWQVSVAQKTPSHQQQATPLSQEQVGAKGIRISAAPMIKTKPANPVLEASTGNGAS